MRIIFALLLTLPGTLAAESLCGVTDRDALLTTLAGTWTGDTYVSSVNAVVNGVSVIARADAEPVTITADGDLGSDMVRAISAGTTLPLPLADRPVFDVDQVDELLDATDAAILADLLSDTPCGPEDLPQFVISVDWTPNAVPSFDGQVALIPYFTDRILRLDQIVVNTGETVMYLTVSALLTRE
ncbi:hypothetical protein [Loktanella sp. SALINAS62]|uniref:hypothetical protein n=1 Tax=Loktanella sp. SALINAS62 TaxID=2706124 RepID=UPI001B8D7AF8|nr:hypothetical protein [Loktanella sp. SALINAS62]MBS1301595.1 hypothetical protein [Loktanella sp. SALINAS62]